MFMRKFTLQLPPLLHSTGYLNFTNLVLEIATAQRTRPRGALTTAYAAARWCWCTAPRSVATKICITSQRQRSDAYNNFFTIIAGDFLVMNYNG